jgi:hypothetical protein
MSTAPIPNVALASFTKEGSFISNALLSDGDDVVSRTGTVASGSAVLQRGQIVNIDPTTGIIIPAVLGTSAPNAVVAENCDATLAAQKCLVYIAAKVKADALIWPPTGSRTAIADALRDYGILVEGVMLPTGQYTSAIAPVTLTPTSATPTAAGGSANFAVAKDVVGGPGTWFPTKDASATWLNIVTPTVAQTANGTVNYTVAVNAVGQPSRTANIYVNGQTFKITQAAG